MARVPYVDPADVSERVREALEAVPPLNIFRTMAHAETAFRPWLRWGGVLLGELELDPALRELAILRVAQQTPHTEYEWVQDVPIAFAVGATEAQVDAIERNELEPTPSTTCSATCCGSLTRCSTTRARPTPPSRRWRK